MEKAFLGVYGPLHESEGRSVRGAAAALGIDVVCFDNPSALKRELERRTPLALLVAFGSDGAMEVFAHVRGQVRYSGLPVLGVADDRRDLCFGDLYGQGGDDLVAGRSVRSLVSRLRPLAERHDSPAPAQAPGTAVVASTDLAWRTGVGRMLSNAGLAPLYVTNVEDAVQAACTTGTRFVIARDDLPPGGAARALALCGEQGVTVPWVIVAPARRAAALRASLRLPQVVVVDALAPPDHLLFIANDLGRLQLAERRSAPRLLFGAAVAFRPAGLAEDDVGFTYNVSAGGIFVRTLAPPGVGTDVWLELPAPTTDRVVRLVGQVAWRRAFGSNETATVPPGFGVALTGGLPGDLERWVDACRALAERPEAAPRRGPWDQLSQVPPSLVASTVM
jgi:hypothetical protein